MSLDLVILSIAAKNGIAVLIEKSRLQGLTTVMEESDFASLTEKVERYKRESVVYVRESANTYHQKAFSDAHANIFMEPDESLSSRVLIEMLLSEQVFHIDVMPEMEPYVCSLIALGRYLSTAENDGIQNAQNGLTQLKNDHSSTLERIEGFVGYRDGLLSLHPDRRTPETVLDGGVLIAPPPLTHPQYGIMEHLFATLKG